MRKNGFTLIEMMIVFAIITICVAVIYPVVGQWIIRPSIVNSTPSQQVLCQNHVLMKGDTIVVQDGKAVKCD